MGRRRTLGRRVPQRFGLTVDAFCAGALAVDALVERPIPIQQHAHQPTGLDIEVFDAAFLFEKLFMLAGLAGGLLEEQRTTVALGAIALGMLELIGRLHAQAHGTARDAIGVAKDSGMAMLIQGNGSDAAPEGTGLIGIPGIEGGISSDVEGKEAQVGHRLDVEGRKVGHIGLVERQGVFGQHHVSVVSNGGGGNAGAVAEVGIL